MKPFRMFCTCGPSGSLREVLGQRVKVRRAAYTFGERRRSEVVNRCTNCEKAWTAPRIKHRRQAPANGADYQPGSKT